MQRTFVKNLAFLLVLNLLVKPVWILGVNVGVQNAVGPEDYGIYFAVLNLSYIFQVFLDLGIQSFNNKSVAANPSVYRTYLGNMALLKLLLGVVFFIFLFGVGHGLLNYQGRYLYLLSIVGFNVFLSSFLLFLRSNLTGLHLFKWDSIASVADRVLMILICGSLLLFSTRVFEIEWFAYAQTVSYVAVIVGVGLVLAFKAEPVKWQVKSGLLITIIKSSLPFALLNLLMAAYTRLDGIMLEYLLEDGSYQAGIYAQGFKFFEASTMIAFLFAGLLLPIFARQIANKESILPVTKQASEALLIPVLVLVISTYFQSDSISSLLFKTDVTYTSSALQVLMLGLFPISVGYIYGTLLTANGNLMFLNISSLVGLALNIVLNAVLIPKYQVMGAAWATLLTQGIVLGAQFIYAWRMFHFSIKLSLVIRIVIFLAVLLLSVYWIGQYFKQSIFIWALNILIGLGLALSLRILNIKEAVKLLR